MHASKQAIASNLVDIVVSEKFKHSVNGFK